MAQSTPVYVAACEACGTEMRTSQPAKTCSPTCRQAAHRKRKGPKPPRTRECIQCAARFCPVPASSPEGFCSAECRREHKRAYTRAWRAKRNPPVVRQCPRCNRDFQTNTKKKRYCTDWCRAEHYYELNREAIKARVETRMNSGERDHIVAVWLRNAKLREQRKLTNPGSVGVSVRDWRRLLTRYGHCCAYCGARSDRLQMDHVIPLSRGGRHAIGNVLPACRRCNTSKRAKLLSEWRYIQMLRSS